MTVAVVLTALVFWIGVFMVYFTSQGMSPLEHFFGRYEPLPDDLGAWKERGIDEQSGLLREERLLLPPGSTPRYLLLQARYRNPETREIVRVEPEDRVPRRRVKKRASG